MPNGFPAQHDFGNIFLKISTAGGLAVADYFASFDTVAQSNVDNDLGSGDNVLFQDSRIYILNRNAMGKLNANSNNNIYQELPSALSGPVFSTPTYFNNTVYYGAVGDSIKPFAIANASLGALPSHQTSNSFPYPGATPSISANGAANPILWAIENGATAVLHAYDATTLRNELYNSSQARSNRDQFGTGNKFITPTIADGKVYVGTTNGVAVFGLLSPSH